MKTYQKLLNPLYVAKAVRNRFWLWVSRQLQFYLSNTHLTWGDASQVEIGRNVSLADVILNCRSGRIVIEDDVMFGHHVLLLAGKHDYRVRGGARIKTVPLSGHDIIIRRGAWIASNVIVLGPSEIGEDSVVAAGSIVRGDVAPGMIYGGNPARPVKHIVFDDLPKAENLTFATDENEHLPEYEEAFIADKGPMKADPFCANCGKSIVLLRKMQARLFKTVESGGNEVLICSICMAGF